jgi:hypothetical protein
MAEYSRLAKGTVISKGGSTSVILPFQPDYVEFVNFTSATTPALGGIPFAKWDANMGQGAAAFEIFNATPVLTTGTTLVGGISTFSAGIALQFGVAQQVVSMTKASPAVVTVNAHGYVSGDVVMFEGLYQSPTTGMLQICGMPFVVTVTGANTFTIPWNTNQTNYTAIAASPAGATVRKVLFPYLYAPGVSYMTAITLGASTTVVTTAPHNLVAGSSVAFRVPQVYGTTQLNSLPNSIIPGSPIYGFVTSVTNSTTVVVNINSTTFTAFNTNQPFASTFGLSFPQMVAVGDNNTGSALPGFASPIINGVSTINGPAISGAFVNNTNQGFVIGPVIAGAALDVIFYRAYLHDISLP